MCANASYMHWRSYWPTAKMQFHQRRTYRKSYYRPWKSSGGFYTPPLGEFFSELDELESLLESDPEAKGLISPLNAKQISSMSVASWTWSPDYPTDGKFEYPVNGSINRTNIPMMRGAEEDLDNLWKELDAFCRSKTGRILPELLDRDITRGRTIQRTPPWVDPPKVKKGPKAPPLATYVYTYQAFSLLDHDKSTEVTGTFDRLSIAEKSKTKTRGTSGALQVDDQGAVGQETEAESAACHFTVDKRSHKVFKTLVFSPLAGDTPGELPWAGFFHAMVTVGFTREVARICMAIRTPESHFRQTYTVPRTAPQQ
ncbi:hypothetical protein CC86DRAFT_438050 [Ophiobolus disseminans]|uniref:Uncharacterized protein n=1 Tax=Ophiobolus disseminans TaxID=1469910 RepID=A0A6A7A7E1_9PLEO|nr:hypothetical protein CC86DRAFT_438050 [Ophiobolus disseminans]